jgi:hypothetical protein
MFANSPDIPLFRFFAVKHARCLFAECDRVCW